MQNENSTDDLKSHFKLPTLDSALDPNSSITEFPVTSSYTYRTLTIPFAPVWSTGVDVITKFLNLTKTKSEYKVYYSVAHVGIIYNYTRRHMQFLMGHRNVITSISMDKTGKWLVSADNGADHTVIVWDSTECFPVCTLFEPHPPEGVAVVEISPDAKYLVSVGLEENTVVKFWQWTLGNDEADGSFILNGAHCGTALDCNFNTCDTTLFEITFTKVVVFVTWKDNKLEYKICKAKKKYGPFTSTLYIPFSHDCLTATKDGWMIQWGLFFTKKPYEEVPENNNKIFIKAVKLQQHSIEHIRYIDELIACSGSDMGIRFFDLDLKLVYVCLERDIKPSVAIFFNIQRRKFVIKDPENLDSDRSGLSQREYKKRNKNAEYQIEETTAKLENKDDITCETTDLKTCTNLPPDRLTVVQFPQILASEENITELEDDEEDRSTECDEIYLNLLQKDFTLDKSPFLVRDFIILTKNGDFSYIDMAENTVDTFLHTTFADVSCIDTHSEKPLLVVGYSDGWMFCYNFETYNIIQQIQLLDSKQKENNIITCVKYSPEGFYLVAGSSTGLILFLNPVTLEFEKQRTFRYALSKVMDIVFSEDHHYLAYYDDEMAVTLLKIIHDKNKSTWEFYGRCVAHSKPITAILFCGDNRLFTVSEDQYMVEYYTIGSLPGELDIMSRVRIMQTGYPLAFIHYDVCTTIHDHIYFAVATSESKYIIINEKTSSIERTIVGPTIEDMPVSQISIVPNSGSKYMIFRAGKYIGIQLLPLSGNPYKQISLVAHAESVLYFKISNCGNYIFTYGMHDNVAIMWSIRHKSVEIQTNSGGAQLLPYYSLIEGGKEGWLFKEIIDLFYYVQILHQGEDYPFTRNVNDKISTNEIPNLMRAIGYFPSEFELDNILYEVKSYYLIDEDDEGEGEINFENFVKLYLNHRHVKSYTAKEIEWAFEVLGKDGKIDRNHFFNILCDKGEPFTTFTLEHCLSILTNQETYSFSINLLPEEMTSEYFMNEILGVDVDGK